MSSPEPSPGGLLFTGGLRNAGPCSRDGEEWHPLHGRYHSLQADRVRADVKGDAVVIKGTMRETSQFGHVLELKRTICVPVYGAEVTISDELTNLAHWRSMASGNYACGLEPANCYIMGRKAERENGTLPVQEITVRGLL